MSDIQVFNNDRFGRMRTVVDDYGRVLFCGRDVATALGYKNTKDALARHCRGVVKRYPTVDSLGRTQDARFITEGDVFRLITSSKLPDAIEFERLVFDEILPSIRKHGAYLTPTKTEELINNPDLVIQLAQTLKLEREKTARAQAQIEANRPKIIFADAVSASKTSILVGDLAKILKQNGLDVGQNRLFTWLREKGYLIKAKRSDYNMPTQRSMKLGLFEIKETTVTHGDGHITVSKTPKVTGKGQQYFIDLFLGGKAA